jgi:hypothetical protein
VTRRPVKPAPAIGVATTMREALTEAPLLGAVLAGPSWLSWRSLLTAANGESLTDVEREMFTRLTGRHSEPLERVEELWCIAGRRGGESRAAAVMAIFQAVFVDHSPVIVVDEQPSVLCLSRLRQLDQRLAG